MLILIAIGTRLQLNISNDGGWVRANPDIQKEAPCGNIMIIKSLKKCILDE